MEIIASELSKGNCDILKEKKLTKKQQKRIEELVHFDYSSIEKMLQFELDAWDDEKQALQLKAFEILKNKDYESLILNLRKITGFHPQMKIRFNALYIIKNML